MNRPRTSADTLRTYHRLRLWAGLVATVGHTLYGLVEPRFLITALAGFLVASHAVWCIVHPTRPEVAVVFDTLLSVAAVLSVPVFPGAELVLALYLVGSTLLVARGRARTMLLVTQVVLLGASAVARSVLIEPAGSSQLFVATVTLAAVIPMAVWIGHRVSRGMADETLLERSLGSSPEFTNVVTERSHDGIYVLDDRASIRYANPAGAAMFGYTPDDMIGSSLERFMVGDSMHRWGHALMTTLRSAEPVDVVNREVELRHRDGSPLTMRVSLTELSGTTGRRWLITLHDVTEMVVIRRAMERVVASKDQLFASVTHELRTPLTAIIAFVEFLVEEPDMPAEQAEEFHRLLMEQSHEMSFIIDDLLAVSQIEVDTLHVSLEPLQVLPEATRAARLWTPSDFIDIDHRALDITVLADGRRLRQIIRNLVSNAIKYGGDRIRIGATGDGAMAELVVADDGPGVGEARVEAIFDAYQTSVNVEGQPASIGLGLHVSRQLAELMGGRLFYRRRDGWTEFVVRLPMAVGLSQPTVALSEGS